MRMIWAKAAFLLGTSALLPMAASAQDVRDLDSEESNMRSFSGQLDGGPAIFEVALPADTAMRIDVISTSNMDPVLKVYDAANGELITENDDGGDDLNSRATVRGEGDMRLRIEVDSFGAEEFESDLASGLGENTFDLQLRSIFYDPQSVRLVSWGSDESGQLLGGESHEFTFTGEEGILLEVALVAEGDFETTLDPYLTLRDSSGEVVAENDDGGGNLNSLLRYVMTDDSEYTIVASGLGDSGGAYTLRVGPRREPIVQPPVQVVGIGDRATGRLGAGYENGGIDPNSIDYQLSEEALAMISGGAGEVTIRMEKISGDDPDFENTLDPYIEIGFETPLGFAVVQSDDDGAGDLNAMIPVDLSGVANDANLLQSLRIRVTGFGQSQGEYSLTVTEGLDPVEAGYEDLTET